MTEQQATRSGRRLTEMPLRDVYGIGVREERSHLGASLIRHRIAANLSQRELAARIGVSCRCIQTWETDRAWPTLHKVALAAKALGTSMDALWGGKGGNDGTTTGA